jgi:NADH dehydrogenase FAD-containing subunit
MDRRYFLSTGGALLATGSPLAWADDDKKKSTKTNDSDRKSKPKPTPTPTPTPSPVTKSRVIVIGGGMAGATVAKYLRLWGNGIAVTLVERNSSYVSNIMSSLVLTGQRTISSLTYNYSKLLSAYGVQVVKGDVTEIDPVAVKVKLADGTVLSADRIVMAPGIEFDTVPGLDSSNRMPHAWQAGTQTTLLAQQLSSMTAGGTVIMTIPQTPYRCPPGPYERACLIGDWLKSKKTGSKLIVLDANPTYVTEADNFAAGFKLHNIEYVPNAAVVSVDPGTSSSGLMGITTSDGQTHQANVVNMIPRQKAGSLVINGGLANANSGRFAGVSNLTYASTVAAAEKIHIIGDSSATAQPKAGHIANQEAKVCADAIVRSLAGLQPDSAPVTNSACYSTITMTQASWLTAVFQYNSATGAMAAVPASSSASVGWDTENFKDMGTWFNALMADSFA